MADQTTLLVVGVAMQGMVKRGWVDICTIRECVKVLGVIPDGRSMELLHALHCVHFKDMPKELLEQIPALIDRCLQGPSLDLLLQAAAPAGSPVKSFPQLAKVS